MKRAIFSWLLVSVFFALQAQDDFRISKPESTFSDNILTVRYDITGCGNGQFIDISLVVLNAKGDTLRPKFISGDIGNMISCGFGKKIEWNIIKDNLKIDEELQIMILGKKSMIPVSRVNQASEKQFGRGNVILSSVFIPGLGQKKASGKSAYFIFTGLVYGAAGASFYFHNRSNQLLSEYNNASGTERDRLYDQSVTNFNMSQNLLYGAAGAWVINFIWSAVIPIKDNPHKKLKMTLTSTQHYDFLLSAKWNF